MDRAATPRSGTPSIGFWHPGGDQMASFRYRAKIPARELGASVNDEHVDILILSKPIPEDVEWLKKRKKQGLVTIADFCDDHFHRSFYRTIAKNADYVTCNTPVLCDIIHTFVNRDVEIIDDPYEFEEVLPHGSSNRLFWFGHRVNYQGLERVLRTFHKYPIFAVSNIPGCREWSQAAMIQGFMESDIVVLPATDAYKSANRAVEAIRQGCFVVAEPHPALEHIPGIWVGDLQEGVEWATAHWPEANQRTRQAQEYVRGRYAPLVQAAAWRSLLERVTLDSISGAGINDGPDGSMSTTPETVSTLSAT